MVVARDIKRKRGGGKSTTKRKGQEGFKEWLRRISEIIAKKWGVKKGYILYPILDSNYDLFGYLPSSEGMVIFPKPHFRGYGIWYSPKQVNEYNDRELLNSFLSKAKEFAKQIAKEKTKKKIVDADVKGFLGRNYDTIWAFNIGNKKFERALIDEPRIVIKKHNIPVDQPLAYLLKRDYPVIYAKIIK